MALSARQYYSAPARRSLRGQRVLVPVSELLQGDDRALLVPDPDRRSALWTSRVWPGALLVEGEIIGTWRRAQGTVRIQTWRRLSRSKRDAVVAEAESLPLPDIRGRIVVRWDD